MSGARQRQVQLHRGTHVFFAFEPRQGVWGPEFAALGLLRWAPAGTGCAYRLPCGFIGSCRSGSSLPSAALLPALAALSGTGRQHPTMRTRARAVLACPSAASLGGGEVNQGMRV